MSARSLATLAIAAGILATLGCVTSVTEAELERQLNDATERMPLGKRRVVPIWAETRLVAQAMLIEARTDPNSALSRTLGKRLGIAARRGQSVVVGGPYPALSDRVLRNAFSVHDEGTLRGLKVVLVSAKGPSGELVQAAREARARLYHHSVP